MDCSNCERFLKCYACEKALKCMEIKRIYKRIDCFVCEMDCEDLEVEGEDDD